MPPRLPKLDTRSDADRRRHIYADVEELLVPGFLAHQVRIGDVGVSLRSLAPGDLFLLRHRIGGPMTERMWREWAIASAVWMVDGQLILGDGNAPRQIRQVLRELPPAAIDTLFSIYTSLYNRVAKAISRVEAFCYEDVSRGLWRMVGRRSPAQDEIGGIPGLAKLGTNHVQRLWIAFNLIEDDRQHWQQEWAAAKLVASASNPKGIRRISTREESERKLEEERRKRVIEKVYHEATGRQMGDHAGGMVVYRSVTPEELVDEMNRWIRGEKDQHDLIIDAYKEQIRQKHEEERRRHEARMAALTQLQASGVQGQTALVGYSLEQIRAIRGDAPDIKPGGTRIFDGSHPTRIYQKYIERDIHVGGIGKDGKAVPLPRDFGGEGSLAEQVSARQVRLTPDGEVD